MARRDTLAHDRTGSSEGNDPEQSTPRGTATMSKKGRKKRNRKKSAANHGKRPNT